MGQEASEAERGMCALRREIKVLKTTILASCVVVGSFVAAVDILLYFVA